MKQTGIVTEAENGYAMVVVRRESGCGGNCSQCAGCKESLKQVKALNKISAEKGDTVIIESSTAKVLLAALWVYIVPVILFIGGYIYFSSIFHRQWSGFVGAVVLTLIYVFVTNTESRMDEKKFFRI